MKYKNPLSLLSLGFGSGLSPIAPGTVGSFFALVIYYNIFFGNLVELVDQLLFILFIVVSFFIGLYIYPKTVEEQDDPSSFVWDEFVGMWIACIPITIFDFSAVWLVISFLMFRIFDIWKPLGIKYFDNKHGAFYVMLDDTLAGIFSAITVIFLSYFLI
jgi:phosphatidylglycerophosphatase A